MSARFTILGTLASGGMGTVYLARMAGSAGFARPVAIKRLHPQLAAQRDFVTMLVDEARLASQIRHINVIDTLDLVATDGAFSLVLEYVEGTSLSTLMKLVASGAASTNARMPLAIALAITHGVLRGLHAAHDARGAEGQPLGIVHRDVSPQNVLVGVDGIPRLIDFGIVKAMTKMTATRKGEVRGKLSYMAPEQLLERPVTRQVDVYAAAVMLWELLTGRRLFAADDQRVICAAVLEGRIKPPSEINPTIPRELDEVILKATSREVSDRHLTARELLEALAPWKPASADELGAWVREVAAAELAKTNALLENVVPEASRTVDDLMRELAQSGTAMPRLGPHAPNPISVRGTTPEVVEIVAMTRDGSRTWLLAFGAIVLILLGLVGALFGMHRAAPASADGASSVITVESPSPTTAFPNATSVLEPSSAILPAPLASARLAPLTSAPSAPSTAPASRPTSLTYPRKRPTRSAPARSVSDPLDHR
jgi:eukaryotic-like serine/threonine-protein kinase